MPLPPSPDLLPIDVLTRLSMVSGARNTPWTNLGVWHGREDALLRWNRTTGYLILEKCLADDDTMVRVLGNYRSWLEVASYLGDRLEGPSSSRQMAMLLEPIFHEGGSTAPVTFPIEVSATAYDVLSGEDETKSYLVKNVDGRSLALSWNQQSRLAVLKSGPGEPVVVLGKWPTLEIAKAALLVPGKLSTRTEIRERAQTKTHETRLLEKGRSEGQSWLGDGRENATNVEQLGPMGSRFVRGLLASGVSGTSRHKMWSDGRQTQSVDFDFSSAGPGVSVAGELAATTKLRRLGHWLEGQGLKVTEAPPTANAVSGQYVFWTRIKFEVDGAEGVGLLLHSGEPGGPNDRLIGGIPTSRELVSAELHFRRPGVEGDEVVISVPQSMERSLNTLGFSEAKIPSTEDLWSMYPAPTQDFELDLE